MHWLRTIGDSRQCITFIHHDVSVTQMDQWNVSKAIVKLSVTVTNVRGLQMQHWQEADSACTLFVYWRRACQAMESYRCYVYRTSCQANYPSHVAAGVSTPFPSPTVTTTFQSTYSGYGHGVSRLDTRLTCRQPAGGCTYRPTVESTVIKRS